MSELEGVKFDNGQIVCRGITVKSRDGKYTASLTGVHNGVGFWMTEKDNPTRNLVAIYKIGSHTVIGLYDGEKDGQQAIDMGICSAGEGAFLQVSPDTCVSQITKEDIAKLV